MTFGEQLFFGLIVAAFMIFGVSLAIVASRTSRYMRRKASETQDASMPRAA